MLVRFVAIGILLGVAAPLPVASSDSPLTREIGRTRPLIIIASTSADPILVRFERSLGEPANKRAFAERDMVLFTVVGTAGQRDGKDLNSAATRSLIRELKLDDGPLPKVILVGKDGGKKIERSGSIELTEVFRAIDAMPMRKNEVGMAARRGR